MPGMLNATCIGHCGGDPETRFLQSGQNVCSFSIGCSVGSGDRKATEWVRVSAFGKLGEIAQEYLAKGRLVYVEGRLTTRSYDTAGGERRFSLDVTASNIQLIGSRQSSERPEPEDLRGLDSIPF